MIPGVAHHVTQRGNNRQDIFFVDDDRRLYLRYLQESAALCGLRIDAYCLMTNHVHLVATPATETALARAIGRTHLMYAQYVHRMHRRAGHFWQNRFYSCPLDEAHTHNAMAYVELNPVRARMLPCAWKYPWSSAGVHCGHRQNTGGLLSLRLLQEMTPSAWQATLKAIGGGEELAERMRTHTRTGRPLGDDAFLAKIETLLGRRVRPLPIGRQKGWRKERYPEKEVQGELI